MADPRRLRPGELLRLLNSTRLGEVVGERGVKRQRERAGAAIRPGTGESGRVDFVRYVAWLIGERHRSQRSGVRGSAAGGSEVRGQEESGGYEGHKARAGARQREKTRAGQDIGPLPGVKEPARRAEAEKSFQRFCEIYFPLRFYLRWSADLLQVLARIEEAICLGGYFALALPRGGGKTSLCEVGCLWAVMTGRHEFFVLLAVNATRAGQLLDAMKTELLCNELLAEDFPEVCHPIRALEDRANRAKGQHIAGHKTYIGWRKNEIVLPWVEGSKASCCLLRVAGLKSGNIRGAKFTRPDGRTVRPSGALIDDPQDDQSARSLVQVEERLRLLNGAVLGMAGPGMPFTAVCPCTVIEREDVADTLLNREKSPLWTGQRYALVTHFPDKMELWEEYWVRRCDELRNGGSGALATVWYGERKEEMERGAVVSWAERKKPDELSAVQHAMNLFFHDRRVFASEYQNQPLEQIFSGEQLEAEAIVKRLSGLGRGVVPLACQHVTAFVDVQKRVLYYLVAAWAEDFTGSVIDYGTWPDQGRPYFTAGDVQKTIARAIAGAGQEGQIHGALGRLADELLGRVYQREDQVAFKIGRCLIDAGFATETVKRWCRTTAHAALVMPSHGHGIGASGKPWAEYDRKRCEKFGAHWLIPKAAAKGMRHVMIDTNYWKSFVAQRLGQAVGDRGALTLWGAERGARSAEHKMIADQWASEYWIETEGRGRKVHEWRLRPGQTENHWWDCLVGAAVAASMQGCELLEGRAPPPAKRMTLEEFKRRKRERRGS